MEVFWMTGMYTLYRHVLALRLSIYVAALSTLAEDGLQCFVMTIVYMHL